MTNQETRVYGYLGLSMKAGKLSFGTDSVIEATEKHRVKLILIAGDSSEKTIKNFKMTAEDYHVPLIVFGTIEAISKAIGKENKAVVGVKDTSIANEIKKLIDGGDTIG